MKGGENSQLRNCRGILQIERGLKFATQKLQIFEFNRIVVSLAFLEREFKNRNS